MHIPDGYLGPQTYVPALGVMAGMWAVAVAKLRKSLRLRQVPLLALGAAFSFVIMMFNVPIPGGTTGHAVGAVLVAILFGPWAAVVVVSLALMVQALIFGDGGITAIGANCFNMAVVCPFVGWGVYRLIAGSTPAQSARQWIGGAVGGWLGLTTAAVVAGVEFGVQPLIAHDAAGRALYCPFGLGVAVPAMALEHMLLFGPVEALVTALVVVYFQRTAPEMLGEETTRKPLKLVYKLALILGVLVLLTPLGLYLPAAFHAGAAWGEWSGAEVKAEIARQPGGKAGYVPAGIARAEERGWKGALPDYGQAGQGSAPLSTQSTRYVFAGAVGVIVLGFLMMLLQRVLARKGESDGASTVDAGTQRRP